ncbi:unnamed protein product [Heterosigma akashiwo]
MLVYKCMFTDDELMSDSYKIKDIVDEDGEVVPGLFGVESKIVAVGGGDIDIGCGNAFGGDDDAGGDDGVEKENNIISESAGFGLTEMPFNSKAEFKAFLKDYVRKVRSEMKSNGVPQEEIKQMMNEAPIFVKYLLSQYSELQFYVGRSMDPEGTMIFARFYGEDLTPTFVYIKAGLKQEKF